MQQNHKSAADIKCSFSSRISQRTLTSTLHCYTSFPCSHTRSDRFPLPCGRCGGLKWVGASQRSLMILSLSEEPLTRIPESAAFTASLAPSCEVTRCRAGRATLRRSPPFLPPHFCSHPPPTVPPPSWQLSPSFTCRSQVRTPCVFGSIYALVKSLQPAAG